jgi:hypothetical protein
MIRSRGLSSVLLLLPLLSATCGEETRFFIVQNQVPESGCSISGARSSTYRGEGTLDTTLVSESASFAYDIYPLLQNDLPAVGTEGAPQPNRLSLKGFHVDIELAAGAPATARQVFDAVAADPNLQGLLSYDEATSGTLEPGGNLASGVGAFPAELARRLLNSGVFSTAPRVRATIRLRALASRQSGDMESTEFRYPLDICAGCLVALRGSCPVEKLENPGNACRYSQDNLVDCCLDSGRLRCPAPVKSTGMTTTTTTTTTP